MIKSGTTVKQQKSGYFAHHRSVGPELGSFDINEEPNVIDTDVRGSALCIADFNLGDWGSQMPARRLLP